MKALRRRGDTRPVRCLITACLALCLTGCMGPIGERIARQEEALSRKRASGAISEAEYREQLREIRDGLPWGGAGDIGP